MRQPFDGDFVGGFSEIRRSLRLLRAFLKMPNSESSLELTLVVLSPCYRGRDAAFSRIVVVVWDGLWHWGGSAATGLLACETGEFSILSGTGQSRINRSGSGKRFGAAVVACGIAGARRHGYICRRFILALR